MHAEDVPKPPAPNKPTSSSFAVDFIAGGVAGAVSRTAVSPLERMKILFQIHDSASGGRLRIWPTLRGMWTTEGVPGLFKGNWTNCVRIVPYSAVQFASYELSKKLFLGDRRHGLEAWERMVAGAFAGVCSVTATYPLDLIRTRLSLPSSSRVSSSIVTCARQIYTTEGGLRALYRGLGPTLAGVAPYVALNFTVYEGLKTTLKDMKCARRPDAESGLGIAEKLACGGAAGAVAQTFTYPFDVIRRRMQVCASAAVSYRHATAFDAFAHVLRTDGITGLFKGMLPNYLKVIPAISLSFATFELIKAQLVPDK